MPSTRDVTICTAASTIRGRFSTIVSTMESRASTTAGMICGRSVSKVSSTLSNRSVTVERSVGSSSPKASKSPSIAVGSATTMFCTIGTTFLRTVLKSSTMFKVKSFISASALPSPATKELTAAFISPMEPCMVSVDSLAKLPEYCSVFSKKYDMASSALSALDMDAQAVSMPLERA